MACTVHTSGDSGEFRIWSQAASQRYDSTHRADVPVGLPWQLRVTWQWPPLKRIAILTCFENLWHKEKRVGTIDIMDVYTREVSKLPQKIITIAAMLVEKLSAIELY